MMRKRLKAFTAILMAGCMTAGLAGGAAVVSAAEEPKGDFPEPVELTIATFRVGTHNAAAAEARYFKEFQEKYNGIDNQKITLKVEEMPSDEEYYKQMKIRATSNDLPDVFEGNGGVLEMAIKNGIAVDMSSYVDADEQYKKELGAAYDYGKQWEDGGLYNISYGLQAIGYFYNKEMFEKAGITPAKDWEEWESNLQKLKEVEVCKAPVSMMTGENGWTTNLILASKIGTNGETGNTFMNTKYVDTYQTPEFIDGLSTVQKMLQEYALPDAVGSDYATAANHFLNEETAIIANGPWMTTDFTNPDKAPEGFADKVGVALFPENGAVSQYERGYSIAKSDKAHEDAAFKFIQFKTSEYGQSIHLEEAGVLPLTSNVEMSEDYKAENPLVVEFVGLLDSIEYKYQTIDTISYATALNAFPTLYPELVQGSLTPEDMAKQLDELAAKDALYEK
ncbi:extracellular solute-binding protein [Blautia schinkii]|nr:extracellular solute-binding protein [Blautia schinkii]